MVRTLPHRSRRSGRRKEHSAISPAAAHARVLDVGAGTVEFSAQLRNASQPGAGRGVARGFGDHANNRFAALAPRLKFETGDAFQLAQAGQHLRSRANRHMSSRSTRRPDPGRAGPRHQARRTVHVLAETIRCAMMSGRSTPTSLAQGPIEFSERTNTDSRIGRKAWTLLRAADSSTCAWTTSWSTPASA